MVNNFTNQPIVKKMYWKFFKILFTCNAASLMIYSLLQVSLFNVPFEITDETLKLVNLPAIPVIACGLFLFNRKNYRVEILKMHSTQFAIPTNMNPVKMVVLLTALIFISCKGKLPVIGVEKDINTGLVTTYKNMKPGKVMMLMNDEIMNHNDIPMGESFLLVNDQLTGLEVKDGKVSIGASLLITDKTGKVLLNEEDLFKGKDVLNKDSVNYLKCTVPTGKPMEWEEKYDIAVTFWDKYGDGKIENKVTIRCIDIP